LFAECARDAEVSMGDSVAERKFERRCDVAVAGGGVAGIAAAIQCARAGLDVVLLEKTVVPGGLATAGFVNVFLPLCDGNGVKIVGGIAEEFIRAAVGRGPGGVPEPWREGAETADTRLRYMAEFAPAVFALELHRMLEEAGVEVWFDTTVRAALLENGRIASLEVFNKSGDGTVCAETAIDATGDADVAFLAGCPTRGGTSALSAWTPRTSMERAASALELDAPELLLEMERLGARDGGRGATEGVPIFEGIDGKTVSEAVQGTLRMLRERHLRENPDPEKTPRSFPLAVPALPQLRTTRRVEGMASIGWTVEDSDAVASIPDWRERGRVWRIPLGALIPKGASNLLAAGRCVSAADGDAWDAARAIPACALTGQIAGIAAALSIESGTPPANLDPEVVTSHISRAY